VSEVARPAGRAEKTAARAPRTPRAVRAHCELDDWWFDPRYTDGKCPICGWQPEGAPAAPLWLAAARRFEWELTGLVLLLVVLVVLGVAVAAAAGYRLPQLNPHHPAAAAAGQASGSRVGASPSPKASAHMSPSPKKSP
jgi:hypothetical protein